MRVEVVKKKGWGIVRLYIYNSPEVANAVTSLTGRKTLRQADLDALSVLGLEFDIIDPYVMERELWKDY